MIELSMIDDENLYKIGASLKVIGVGGAGSNAVNSMVNSNEFQAVEFIVANTDQQALEQSPAPCKIQLGAKITKGLGAGSNPELGRMAAEENLENVSAKIKDSDILFLTAGLGGGTGTGGLPVIATAAKELGILTVAVVTKPFLFEGKRRLKYAEETIEKLRTSVDTLIVVPNQRLIEISDPKISMLDAFSKSNEILKQAIKGISDIITKPGHINVDFADVRAIMKEAGMAIMGTGSAVGPNRAEQAALAAINSPLIENSSIVGAKGILINITGNIDLGLHEISQATTLISQNASEDANIILGSAIDTNLKDEIVITVIATGFERAAQKVEFKTSTVTTTVKTDAVTTGIATVTDPVNTQSVTAFATKETEEIKIDLNDFDTPAFMRKKASADLTNKNSLE